MADCPICDRRMPLGGWFNHRCNPKWLRQIDAQDRMADFDAEIQKKTEEERGECMRNAIREATEADNNAPRLRFRPYPKQRQHGD